MVLLAKGLPVGGSGNANSFKARVNDLPVAVGFGVSTAEQVRKIWRFADAAVVGSAIVHEIEKLAGSPNLVSRIGEFVQSLLPPKESAIERTIIRKSTSNA